MEYLYLQAYVAFGKLVMWGVRHRSDHVRHVYTSSIFLLFIFLVAFTSNTLIHDTYTLQHLICILNLQYLECQLCLTSHDKTSFTTRVGILWLGEGSVRSLHEADGKNGSEARPK